MLTSGEYILTLNMLFLYNNIKCLKFIFPNAVSVKKINSSYVAEINQSGPLEKCNTNITGFCKKPSCLTLLNILMLQSS